MMLMALMSPHQQKTATHTLGATGGSRDSGGKARQGSLAGATHSNGRLQNDYNDHKCTSAGVGPRVLPRYPFTAALEATDM